MRVAVIVLVAFVVLFVVVTGAGAMRHGSEPAASSSNPPAAPSFDAWGFAPAFLKVGANDVSTHSAIIEVAPGAQSSFVVFPATAWYQPKRLLRLIYVNASAGGSVGLSYPPIAPPAQSSATPDPLTAGKPRQLIVLPQGGGLITATCNSPAFCELSL